MRKTRLYTPGPTPLMPEAQAALARPIIHHRTGEFEALFHQLRRNLQEILRTRGEVVILASSGTGAMEAAVSNLLSPEDQALAVVTGKFGERWLDICRTHRIPCTPLSKGMGKAATVDEICRALEPQPAIRALLLQGCETSTATSHDLEAIGIAVRERFPQVLVVVDAITALLTQPIHTDAWGLDVIISGSQKSVGLPPGLAFLSLSQRALERIQKGTPGTYYFNLLQEVAQQKKGQTAFTPAVSLIDALYQTTCEILRQGPDRIVAEAEIMARSTREALGRLGFKLLSDAPAAAVTAAFPPPEISAVDLIRRLEKQFGVKIAGGQGSLKGKIIRIAHLGYFDLMDTLAVIGAIELCLLDMGHKTDLGAGVQTALRVAAERARPVEA